MKNIKFLQDIDNENLTDLNPEYVEQISIEETNPN